MSSVSRGLSEEASAFLQNRFPAVTYPARDDIEGWDALAAQTDVASAAWFARLQLPVDTHLETKSGVPTYVSTPTGIFATDAVALHLHGGALIFGGGEAAAVSAGMDAVTLGMEVWGVDYRMPPRHPYPAALDDVIAVYRTLLDEAGAKSVYVVGGSAGGNLAAALVLRAKDEGLRLPRAVVLLTPEVDLTESGDTFESNRGRDLILSSLREVNELYANGHPLTHPYVSPLFGDVKGFPPTFLQSGTRDLFLSNTVRMHRALRGAGVDAELHVFEAMPHGGFGGASPEDNELRREISAFIDRHRG